MATRSQDAREIFNDIIQTMQLGNYKDFLTKLDNLEDKNYTDSDGKGLLVYCIENNDYPALLTCIKQGANVNIQDMNNFTPLHYAIFKGFLPLAATLLQAHADPNIADKFTRTPLFFAVRKQDLRAMKLLLDFNANPDALIVDDNNEDPRMRRRSLLSIAVYNGSAECAKMLLMHGANPLPEGTEPLIAALNNETRETLAVLLKDRPRDVLRVIEEKPFIVHAIEMKSNLLPIVSFLVRKEIKQMEENHESNIPKYPPKGLKRSQKKELEKAENLQDERITADFVDNAVIAIKNPWKNINDQTLYM